MEEDENCDVCGGEHSTEVCPELGLDIAARAATQLSRARLTLPHNLDVEGDVSSGTLQVFATFDIPPKTQFGPFEAKRSTNDVNLDGYFALKVLSKDQASVVLDCCDENECNWLCLVQCAESKEEQNCIAYQLGVNIFYNTTRLVRHGEKLKVWYATQYAKKLGKPVAPDGATKVMLGTDIGEKLSVPRQVVDTSTDEETIGKRRRKVNTYVEEFLQSARKKVKTEPEDKKVGVTPKRGRGRPRKYPKIEPATPEKKQTQTEESTEGETGGDGDNVQAESTKVVEDNEPDAGDAMDDLNDIIEAGEVEGGEFQCTRCPKTFRSQPQMVMHLRTHIMTPKLQGDPVRTLFCMECGKGFVNNSNLGRHMKIHANKNRTISCKLCDYKTYRHDIMRNHMDARHNAEYTTPKGKDKAVLSGKKRGRKPGTVKKELASPSKVKAEPEVTPRRILPARRNRGNKMMEVLSPFKKKKSGSDEDDEDEDVEVIEDSGSEAHLSEEEEDDDDMEEERKPLAMSEEEEDGEIRQDAGDGMEIGEVTIPEGETLIALTLTDTDVDKEGIVVDAETLEPAALNSEQPSTLEPAAINSEQPSTLEPAALNSEQPSTLEPAALNSEQPSTLEPAALNSEQPSTLETAALNSEQPTKLDPSLAGPDISTAQPDLSTAQPDLSTAQPDLSTAKPDLSTAQPDLSTAQPDLSTAEPDPSPAEPDSAPTAPTLSASDQSTTAAVHSVEIETVLPNNESTEETSAPDILKADGESEVSGVQGEADGEMTGADGEVTAADGDMTAADGEVPRDEDLSEEEKSEAPPVKRKRGRPRKSDPPLLNPKPPKKDQFDIFLMQDDRMIYGCKECGKKFLNLKYMRLHSEIHAKQYACKQCGKTFARKEACDKHVCASSKPTVVRTTVGGRVRYNCTACEKSFVNEDYARQHYSIHSGLFNCEVCQQRFHSKLGLASHKCNKEAVDRKSFACDICSQSFRTASYLFRHMAMHTDIFKCNVCNKCFSRKDSLQRHVLRCDPVRAIEEDLHACVNCHKAYASQNALENHMQVCYKTYCFSCKRTFLTEEECSSHTCNPEDADNTPRLLYSSFRVSCHICNKSFSNLKYLKRHEMSHGSDFRCKICSKSFSRKEELIWHITLCENEEKIKTDGSVKCDLCEEPTVFTDAKRFREHHYTHTHPYQCEKCRKRFRKKGTIHTHVCEPYVYQEGGFKCPQCDKVFSQRIYMERHAVIHGERNFKCEVCNKKFFRQDYVSDHKCVLPDGTPARIVRRHNQVVVKENVVCHLCGATFVSSSNLNKHLKTHGEKQYECDICGKKFHYLAYMKDHRFHVHGGGLELQCAMCGKILKTKTSLKCHVNQFHSGLGPQHECTVCHKRFRQKGNLKTHMYSHSTEKQFHCKICNKSYKYPDQFAHHNLEHTMKDKIKCELCSRQFVKRFEYHKHLAVFHSGMAYICSICKAKCSHRHTLTRHFKRKHPGALHILNDDAYVRSLLSPIEKDGVSIRKRTVQKEPGGDEDGMMAEADVIAAADAAAEAIASAAIHSETTNAATMSIGQTFTNELGETFTESVITDADGVETTIVYQTPEGFTPETDLPQVAAEALQSLSNTIVSSEHVPGTINLSGIQEGQLSADDQHTVVIVQIVNQDEETELGETYTIPQE